MATNFYAADSVKLKNRIDSVLAKSITAADRKLLEELKNAVHIASINYIFFDCDSNQDSYLLNLLGIKPTAYTRGVKDYKPVTPKVLSNVVFTKMTAACDSYYIDTVAFYPKYVLLAKLCLYGSLRGDDKNPNSFRFTLSPCFDKASFEEYVQTFALLK